MLRILIIALILLPVAGTPALARVIETGNVAAQKATPAVVNMSVWKLRKSTTAGEAPRRVKAYGSGFVIDPTGIVTNKHVIDGALDIKVILDDGDRLTAKLLAVAAMPILRLSRLTLAGLCRPSSGVTAKPCAWGIPC
jgi:S1-C subfamily serine protease